MVCVMSTAEDVGEVIGGSLNLLEIALFSPKTKRELAEVSLGDFIHIKTGNLRIVGVVGFMRFDVIGQVQPVGMIPEERKAILPDLEDVVYGNVLKIVSLPVIGYFDGNDVVQGLPPRLPDIHDVARLLSTKDIKKFHQINGDTRFDYFNRLLQKDIGIPAILLGHIFRRINITWNINEVTFLQSVQESYTEVHGLDIPAGFAASLRRSMR